MVRKWHKSATITYILVLIFGRFWQLGHVLNGFLNQFWHRWIPTLTWSCFLSFQSELLLLASFQSRFPALTTAYSVIIPCCRPEAFRLILLPTSELPPYKGAKFLCVFWKDSLRKIHSYTYQTCSLHIYIACNYIGGGGAWTQACRMTARGFDH